MVFLVSRDKCNAILAKLVHTLHEGAAIAQQLKETLEVNNNRGESTMGILQHLIDTVATRRMIALDKVPKGDDTTGATDDIWNFLVKFQAI